MPFIKNQCMFVYAEADLDSNQKMQEPLQKLYQYENQPDMREKIREYINELDTEINRCENELQKYYKSNGDIGVISMQNRIQVLIEVKNDLLGRLKEVTYKGIPSGNNLTKKLPTEKQLNDMEEKIMWKKDIPVRNRNIAIFRVLRGTGIRESELAGLDLSDLHLDEEMPYITILGKGVYREMQNRTVYLSGSALKAIKEWLEYRSTLDNIVDTEAVFINKNGTRTTERNIKQIFEHYGNGITPHMMRHYYASIMNRNGNLAFVQQQLGHSSVNTTVNNYANGAVGMRERLMEM